jgi:D-alanine-D-alanine ligase-like ATP-grasp enzyme
LVSAISEAYEMKFFGPDTYGYIVGQDKSLSKYLAREVGLKTPTWVIVRTSEEARLIDLLAPPLVVKPNLQGMTCSLK